MKIIFALTLLLAALAPLSSCQDEVEVRGNANVSVAPDSEPDVNIVNDAEPDVVVVPDTQPDVVVAPDNRPDVNIVNDAEPDVVVAPDDEPDVIVEEDRDVEVVPVPANGDEVNIPGFEAVFAAAGLIATLRVMRRRA